MTDPIAQHLAHLKQRRYSAASLNERRRILLTLPTPILEITHPQMDAWWESRQTTGTGATRAASSLSGEKSHVRSFYIWARKRDLIDHNPADWIDAPRQTTTRARPIPEGDLYRIMRAAEPPMRQMVALAALAGLRSAEIAAIRWDDVDNANGVLWVRQGKGGKDRTVPLSGGLLAELGDPGEGLIVGKPMTPKAVSVAISRHMRAIGSDYTAHKLRARYATRFLAATGDLQATADVLGHANVETTSRYVIASSDTMRRGAEAAGRIG